MARTALVIGGGFAGLEAAIHLRKGGFEVTLVSNRRFLFIYPTSTWVVTGERSFDQVTLDLKNAARRHGFTFVEGAVESISAARRSAVVNGDELVADHLVVATGGDRLKPKGLEHTFTIGGAYIHRDSEKEQMVPLPVVGHWMVQAWGAYYNASKRKQVPRLPGM